MRTSLAGACAALLAVSCIGAGDGPERPHPTSMAPASGFAAFPVRVVIHGEGFLARPSGDQSGGGAVLDTRHRVWLDEVELGEVAWKDSRTLEATVPAGLSVGLKRLVVENAFGRQGALDRAYEVITSPSAVLEATLGAAPATFNVGQPATVTLTIRNAGGAAAREVAPDALSLSATTAAGAAIAGPSPASRARLEPGATTTFAWSVTAAAPGTLTFVTRARGVDDVSSAEISSPTVETSAAVQVPADLTATIAADRTSANVGQAFAVTLTLANGGSARADVTAVTPQVAGTAASCGAVTPAMPQSLDAGASLPLTWTCTGSAPGTLSLTASVEGADGTSGAPLAVAPAVPAAVAVQTAAVLSATVAVQGAPTTVSVGAALAVTLGVDDAGEAGANVTRVDPTVTPPNAATCGAPAPQPPQAVAGLGTVTFSWSCTALVAGRFTLGASVGGADANDGAALEATAPAVALQAQIPAVLTATVAASRSTVDVGQAVLVTFTLINGGTATAEISAVAPAVSGTATASCGAPSPAAASVPGGGTRAFTYTCSASSAGSLVLSGTASGTDGVTSTPISATPAVPAELTVQVPASLAASTFVSSRTVAVTGQPVDVTLVLANAGEAAADLSGVVPWVFSAATASCTAASPAPPQRIGGGTSLTLSWTCTATAPGGYSLGATVSATDVNTSQLIAPALPPLALTVQTPAALSVASFAASRPSADVGQAVTVTLTVTNGGGTAATVNAVAPSIAPPLSPGCTEAAPPTPQDLPAGGSLTFSWTCTASEAGSATLGASISAVDALTGTPLAASANPLALTVQSPAALTASIAVGGGSTLVVGQAVSVSLTVSNGGGAPANVSAVTPSATGGGGATCTAAAPALPRTLAGGGAETFTWTCTPAAPGSLTLSASVSGTDANTGASLQASADPGVTRTVVSGAGLAVADFTASRTIANTHQAVSLTLTISNGGGTAATVNAVTPSIAPSTTPGCAAATPATPQELPAGGSLTFTWTCTASSARSYTLGASVSAVDAATGAPLSAAASSLALTVQAPASLTASMAVGGGSPLVVGQPASVTLTVSNGGGASANLSAVTPSATGGAGATCTAPAPAPPGTVAGGASGVFTWTCTPAAAGTLVLGASVSGTDENSGASLAASVDPGVTRTVVAGAGLAVAAFTASRTTANTGQAVTVTLSLENGGGTAATVNAVTPSITPAASPGCTVATPSTPRTIPDGESRTFTWTCTASGVGSYTLGAAVSGVDAVTGAPLSANPGPLGLTVQSPPSLIASIAADGPDPLAIDETVGVTLTVSNLGGATATLSEVKPSASGNAATTCTAASPALPLSLEGGASASFTWTCTPTRVGSTVLDATVKGTDANTGAPLEAGPDPGVARTVISGTSLAVASFVAGQSVLNTGEAVTVSLTVSNGGRNAGTVTSLGRDMTPSGTSSCSPVSPSPPRAVPAGGEVRFDWTCTATQSGSYSLTVTIAARDAADEPVPLSAAPIPVTVQTPALLAPELQASRATADVGQVVGVTLALENQGEAGANVSAVTPSVSGAGAASCSDPSPAAPLSIGSGQRVTLTWSCTGSAAGAVTLSAVVAATDANTGGAANPAVAGATVQVQTPAAVTATLTPGTPSVPAGAPVAVTLVLDNGGGGPAQVTGVTPTVEPASASCTAADPGEQVVPGFGAVTFTWTCTGTSAGPHTLGAVVAATAANTGATLAVPVPPAALEVTASPPEAPGSEVVLVAVDPLGDGSADPLLGASGDAVWVGPGKDGRTLAWIDPAGVEAPVLRVPGAAVASAPAASSFAAGAADGVAPSDPAGARVTPAGVTAVAAIEGILYAAGANGISRSSTPRDGVAASWVDATPADPAWRARASVDVEVARAAESWPARDRAVPAIVAFGACGEGPCVFAARNVAGRGREPPVTAQLWRCAPSGGAGACRPADWALAAPDGDAPLTRLGDPESGAITLLAATPRWVYVGLDAPAGVRLFRAAAGPRAAADLLGRSGCAAASPGCAGLGGDGLGDRRVTRFLRASVLTTRGVTSLWIVAGDGVGPARIYRVDD